MFEEEEVSTVPVETPVEEDKPKQQMAGDALSSFLQSFKDKADQRRPTRKARKQGIREKMGDAYKTEIKHYDTAAYGGKRFDKKDLKHLRNAGYKDKKIAKYVQNLGKNNVGESIRHDKKYANIAGSFATADMKEGADISEHDVGKGFNMSDVNYLKSQGFGNEEIASHAHKYVTEGGKRHGMKMARWMEKQGKLDYNHGDWRNASGVDSTGPSLDAPSTDEPAETPSTGDQPATDPQEFADQYKYEVGKYIHKPRDYSKISTNIANDALRRSTARDLPELKALQNSVNKNPLYWKARSDEQTGNYLGDIWNFDIPAYQMPEALDKVDEPDIEGISDKYLGKIDSIKPEL